MNGKIGPHEGVEFILFDRGEKHVIYFNWDCWPEDYFAAAKLVGAKTMRFTEPDGEKESYIFYRDGYEEKAEELKSIILSKHTVDDSDFEEKEYRIGEILDYKKEDVALFISNFKVNH
ncbi:hypothetical protein [Marinomonas posidonica]|uniref:Uncharacterized protein n=1 Tax=Marinomonas posidonica (strain CECT 7376 / NCIMB 14433 / IVIA-Po-181) TaxID=491952 RepID=F6CVB0_MARPP|nr:hypothetical protein [Marinomonas posidonica]AEF54220.1 hypothetical protein Mar181_1173 [Marinomonas posidonica IVIA-Po-181]